MNTRQIIRTAICFLFVAAATVLHAQTSQKLRELSVGSLKPVLGIPPSQDSTVIIVRSTIPDLRVESSMGERYLKTGEGTWRLYLYPDTQKLYFNAPGYKQEIVEYRTLQKNRIYELQVSPKKRGIPWLWIGLGAGAVGGALAALSGGGDGPSPPPTVDKLPDPPGGPTGN